MQGNAASESTNGIVYIAWGTKYVKEAIDSAKSLKRHSNYEVAIITKYDCVVEAAVFDIVINLDLTNSYRDKVLLCNSPFSKTLFLDTDTTVIGDISELFDLLERFDFFFQAADGGLHYSLPGVPMHAFPEPSAGVLGWRKNEITNELFKIWAEEYDDQERLNGPGAWDQRSLRAALWRSRVNATALQGTWQLYTWISTPLLGPVRILHGRGKQVQSLEKAANRSLDYRIYIPRIGMISFHKSSPKQYAKLVFLATNVIVRRVLRLTLAKTRIWRLPRGSRPM